MSGQRELDEAFAARQQELSQEEAAKREKRENRRFWINTAISVVAAIGAVLSAIFTAISLFR